MPALITWWTQDLAALSAGADPALVAGVGADLLGRWTEPHRRYHGTRHLVEMFWALAELTEVGDLAADGAVLGRVAAWFHDAVYDPAAGTGVNERASAALAEEVLPTLGLPLADVPVVVDLVRMTADHVVAHGSALDRAFHDADLWILGAPQDRFDEYCAQVREEYAPVPDPLYSQARSRILGTLVSGPVYLTPHATSYWATRARANVGRELARLAGSS